MIVQTESQSKFSKPSNGNILYNIQAFLVSAGCILTVVTLIVSLVKGAVWPTIAGVLATMVAYGCVFLYSFRGFRQSDARYFLAATYGVAAMLFFRGLMPNQTMLAEALAIASFGSLLVFAERMDRPDQGRRLLLIAIALLTISALVLTFMPRPADVGPLQGVLLKLLPWSQVVLVGSIALAYHSR